jgi:molecular chaperone GrpE
VKDSSARPTERDLQALQSEHRQALAELKRCRADYENLRRALDRELNRLSAWATERVASELARLEPWLAAAQTPADAKGVYDDVLAILARHGVEAIPAEGRFDPVKQQAVLQAPGPEGQVVLEMRRGYTNGGRVVRPAMVAVGSGE